MPVVSSQIPPLRKLYQYTTIGMVSCFKPVFRAPYASLKKPTDKRQQGNRQKEEKKPGDDRLKR